MVSWPKHKSTAVGTKKESYHQKMKSCSKSSATKTRSNNSQSFANLSSSFTNNIRSQSKGKTTTAHNFFFFSLQIFQGNYNPTNEVRAFLPKQTLTRYIRIRPMTWEQGICMRFEIYGCRTSGNFGTTLQDAN